MQKLDDNDVVNDVCEVTRMLEQEVAKCKTGLSEEYDMTSKMEDQEVEECKADLGDDYDMTKKIQEQEVEECRKDADLCNYARLELRQSAWNEMKRIGQGRSLMEWICALKRKEGECKLRWAVIEDHDSVARQSVDIATETRLCVVEQDQDQMAVMPGSSIELAAIVKLGDKTGQADSWGVPAVVKPNFKMKIAARMLGDSKVLAKELDVPVVDEIGTVQLMPDFIYKMES